MPAIIAELPTHTWHTSCNKPVTYTIDLTNMDHQRKKAYSIANRIGFHYFPDGLHYGEKDLELWLPRLKDMDAQWLVLNSPASRAVPEDFIRAFAQSKVKTILDFNYPLADESLWPDMETLLRSYGKWGVSYAILDQRPNSQSAWGENFWKQSDLVNTYTCRFLHFAELALDCGIKPVFAPLLPGGDYWDLAFLEIALKVLSDSASSFLINNTALSAFAWDFGHSLNWGAGGSKAWQEVKAYKVPQTSQDQRGFRAHEWYSQTSQKVLGKKLPIIMLQAGITNDPLTFANTNLNSGTKKQLLIYQLLKEENVFNPEDPENLINAIAPEVLACNFYLLSEESGSSPYAWFSPDGSPRAIAEAIINRLPGDKTDKNTLSSSTQKNSQFEYDNYILISEALKPRIQEILQKMHPFIAHNKPLVGFSLEEAKKAASILVIASENDVDASEIETLQSSGRQVRLLDPENLSIEINESTR
jgi:hypothetical protein